MSKDYYNTLGVSKDASPDEIKRAYKKLAKKYHPDINKDAGAEDKFKEINEAFGVLGNPQNKQKYDQFGTADTGDFGNFGGFGAYDFSDLFGDIFSGFGFGGRPRQRSNRGSDLLYELEVELEDVVEGVKKTVVIPKAETCKKCDGKGVESEKDVETCKKCDGTGMFKNMKRTPFGVFATTTPCPDCRGEGKIIKKPCSECDGEGRVNVNRKIEVSIPAGVNDGDRLRISGHGEAGLRGGTSGDLYVAIRLKPHKIFKRDNQDLYCKYPITYPTAVFGGEITVPTINGEAELKIPAGTQPGTLFKLKGKGLPSMQYRGNGDQFVRVTIDVPKKLNKKQKKLLEEYGKEIGDQPKKGFFERMMGG